MSADLSWSVAVAATALLAPVAVPCYVAPDGINDGAQVDMAQAKEKDWIIICIHYHHLLT